MAETYRPPRYWTDLLSSRFDLRGVGYPGLSVRFNELLYAGMAGTVDRALRRARPDGLVGDRVLDVGSGVGFWIDFFLQRGVTDLTGVDLTAPSVERLSERYPSVRFEQRDVADPWDERFDVISVMSVLNHIPEAEPWERALRNLATMLRPGGTLLIMDPIARHTVWSRDRRPVANGLARTVAQHAAPLHAGGVRLDDVLPTVALLANPVDARRPREYALLEAWWKGFTFVAGRNGTMRAATPLVWPADRALCRLGYMPTSKTLVFSKPCAA